MLILYLIFIVTVFSLRTKLIEIIYNLLLQEKKRRLLKEIDDYLIFFEPIYTSWFSKYYLVKENNFYVDFDTRTDDTHHTKTLTYFPNNYDILFIKRQYFFNEKYSGCVIMPTKFLKHFNRKKFNIISKDDKVSCIPPFVFDNSYNHFDYSIRGILDQQITNNFCCGTINTNEIDELKYLVSILEVLYTHCKNHKIN